LFDNLVVGERNSLLVDAAVTPLVDQLADCLQVGLAEVMSWYGVDQEQLTYP
jgi:hypothetical protein